MSNQAGQKAELRALAAQRTREKAARHRRVIELHSQRLLCSIIARRLGMGDTAVHNVLAAAGLRPWRPHEVDQTGIPV